MFFLENSFVFSAPTTSIRMDKAYLFQVMCFMLNISSNVLQNSGSNDQFSCPHHQNIIHTLRGTT